MTTAEHPLVAHVPAMPLQIDENVERELINHRTLVHPNIVKFREVRRPLRGMGQSGLA